MQDFVSLRRMALPLVVVGLLSATGNLAAANERPVKGHGSGSILGLNGDFYSEGIATHLGVFAHYGTFQFAPGDMPGVLAVSGVAVYESANGDKLYVTLDATLNIATGAGSGIATWRGGTGRFVGAAGGAEVHAQFAPSGSFVFAFQGAIDTNPRQSAK